MSQWGNKELRFLSGTSVNTGGATGFTLTGVGTSFTTQVQDGQLITIGTTKAEVVKVDSNTSLTLGNAIFAATGSTGFYVTELPKYSTTLEKTTQIFGVDTTEAGATSFSAQHAGWVKVMQQAGYVQAVTLNTTGASGYNPSSPPPVRFSTGGASGIAIVSPDGAVIGVDVTVGGSYTTTAPTVTIGSTGATGVVGTVIMGGRFNRKLYETLVAMSVPKSEMGDAENTIFPV